MVHEYKLIEVEEAHSLKERLDLLDDAYYLDRSTFRPIRGVENLSLIHISEPTRPC